MMNATTKTKTYVKPRLLYEVNSFAASSVCGQYTKNCCGLHYARV